MRRATLWRALADGIDPHGRVFHYYMPRWDLSDEEFDSLLAYQKAL